MNMMMCAEIIKDIMKFSVSSVNENVLADCGMD